MRQPITIFKGSSGLNNVIDPAGIDFDPRSGISELAVAYNVDIDPTGKRVSRRKGFELFNSKASHSIYGWGGPYALFVNGSMLYAVDPDGSETSVATVTAGARMRYAEVAKTGGPGHKVYYMNEHEKGIVIDKINYDWEDEDYVGPTTHKYYSDPPIGHMLEIWHGRMLVAQDNVVWDSEPFAYGRFRKARGYKEFRSRITLMRGVDAGLFVSDQHKQYFLPGTDMDDVGFATIADYPAIEGTDDVLDMGKIGDGLIAGKGWIWTSTKGICIGGADGYFKNLTERKLTYPRSIRGAGKVIGERYVCTLEP